MYLPTSHPDPGHRSVALWGEGLILVTTVYLPPGIVYNDLGQSQDSRPQRLFLDLKYLLCSFLLHYKCSTSPFSSKSSMQYRGLGLLLFPSRTTIPWVNDGAVKLHWSQLSRPLHVQQQTRPMVCLLFYHWSPLFNRRHLHISSIFTFLPHGEYQNRVKIKWSTFALR